MLKRFRQFFDFGRKKVNVRQAYRWPLFVVAVVLVFLFVSCGILHFVQNKNEEVIVEKKPTKVLQDIAKINPQVKVKDKSGDEENISAEVVSKQDGNDKTSYDLHIESEKVDINFKNATRAASDIKVYVDDAPRESGQDKEGVDIDSIKTAVLHFDDNQVEYQAAEVSLKKKSEKEEINAILTCPSWDFDEETGNCGRWEISPIRPRDEGDKIAFDVKHFSAYAGAYLEILNVQSDLTKGDEWTTRFSTYGKSDLIIKAVDGTEYPTDIEFLGLYCGGYQLTALEYDFLGQTITVPDYECDLESRIVNRAVTAGRHWLEFTFADTVARSHNFACDSGTLADTCYVTSSQTMSDGDAIIGSGDLVVGNGGDITGSAEEIFGLVMGGDIYINPGGQVTGNFNTDVVGDALGTGDDSTTDFDFSAPIATGTEEIYLDAFLLTLSTDACATNHYTISSTTVHICTAPTAGVAITANYEAAYTANNFYLQGEHIAHEYVGTTSAANSYNLAYSPVTFDSEEIYVDEVLQTRSDSSCTFGDYILATSTGVFYFCPASIPVNGLDIWVNYSQTGVVAGEIDVSEKGYTGGNGPGAGDSPGNIGAGAGYGGVGGDATRVSTYVGGVAYGDLFSPNDFGSGGGYGGTYFSIQYFGGSGGGMVYISVKNDLTIGGDISSNGGDGTDYSSYRSGGGSGGSVYIIAGDSIQGDGNIYAKGGRGYTSSAYYPGGGAGGRIAVYCNTNNSNLNIIANGNYSYYSNNTSYDQHNGSAGTIYKKASSSPYGELIVDNYGIFSEKYTPILSGESYIFATTTINNYGWLEIETGATSTVTDVITSTNSPNTKLLNEGSMILSGNISDIASFVNIGSIESSSDLEMSNLPSFRNDKDFIVNNLNLHDISSFDNNATTTIAGTSYIENVSLNNSFIFTANNLATGTFSSLINSGTFDAGSLTDLTITTFNNTSGTFNTGSLTDFTGTSFTNSNIFNANNLNIFDVDTVINNGTINISSLSDLVNISLFQNNSIINTATDVTLYGTTFYQDGAWNNLQNLVIGTSSTLKLQNTVTTGNAFQLDNLTIQNTGVLTHQSNSVAHIDSINLVINNDIELQAGGVINADGTGYRGGYGYEGESINVQFSSYRSSAGAGGGHGGTGGDAYASAYSSNYGTASGGSVNGSREEPITIGSGGGYSLQGSISGGSGGGAIKIFVGGSFLMDGTISADGNSGGTYSTTYYQGASGGGSGGSIFILADTIAGNGSISASGGGASRAYGGSNRYSIGGGGGGGRVAIAAVNDAGFSVMTSVDGGNTYGTDYDGLDGTYVLDVTHPVSAHTAICEVSVNGCSDVGELRTPPQAYAVGRLEGQATEAESRLENVKISIKDVNDNMWYDNNTGNFDSLIEVFMDVSSAPGMPYTGTVDWYYDTSGITWTQNHTFEVRYKAIGYYFEEPSYHSYQFEYVNTNPSVANVTASQQTATGLVDVTYDSSDAESSSTEIYLFYGVNSTLAGGLAVGADMLAVNNSEFFPESGTIIVDSEIMSYTSKSGNLLSGVTRGVDNTIDFTHSGGVEIFVLTSSTSVTGDIGSSTGNGVDNAIVWDAKNDLDGFYGATTTLLIVANDGSFFNMIGRSESPEYALDVRDPDLADPAGISVDARTFVDLGDTIDVTLRASDHNHFLMKRGQASDLSDAIWEEYNASWATSTPTATTSVYVQFLDDYGNITSILKATPPEIPVDLIVQDVSNMTYDPPVYALFYAWSTVPDPEFGYKQVNIETRKAASSTFEYFASSPEGLRNIDYYRDATIDFDTLYVYRLSHQDMHDNYSAYSEISPEGKANGAQDAGEGGGGVETTPPTITNIQASEVGTNYAVITWDTDELSNSEVSFSSSTGIFSETVSVYTMTASNTVTLTGLEASTTYYYMVQSTDLVGNTASLDDGGSGYSFTTTRGPIISNVQITSVNNTSATIEWDTDIAADSYVAFASSSDMIGVLETGDPATSTSHSVSLTGLTTGIRYYFYVKSTDDYGYLAEDKNVVDGSIEYYTFITDTDNDPPIITFDEITGIDIIDAVAHISWSTNEPAQSQVEYGVSGYDTQVINDNYNYGHSFTFNNLDQGQTYIYRLISTDANGNQSVKNKDSEGDDLTFTVTAVEDTDPPVISNIATSTASSTHITVSWETDEPSNSIVHFGVDNTYGKIQGDSTEATTTHIVTLISLNPNTYYRFKINSTDSVGNVGEDDDGGLGYVFHTAVSSDPGDTTPPNITLASIATTSVTSNSISISWNTDEASDSMVGYSVDNSYQTEKGDITLLTDGHSVILEGLSPNTIYHFNVKSRDDAGNLQTTYVDENGDDLWFRTADGIDTSYPIISNVGTSTLTSVSATIVWNTNENSSSIVDYGLDTNYGSVIGDSGAATTSHRVVMYNLLPNTTYHYRVRSTDGAGNETVGADHSFTTIASPSISNVNSSDITDKTATVSYNTTQAVYGFVEYGLTTAYGSMVGNNSISTTSHAFDIEGLDPSTTYHYRPRIRDLYGNYTYGSDDTFTTDDSLAPVLVSFISSSTDGIYGPGDTINITANYTQILDASSTIRVELNNGEEILLDNISSSTIYADYTVGVIGSGQDSLLLSVNRILEQTACNDNGNCEYRTSLFPATNIDASSTISVDTTRPVFSDISPLDNAFIGSLTSGSNLAYTLSEEIANGTITITRVGGAVDATTTRICTLTGAALTVGVHNSFDTTTGCAEGAQSLNNGSIYNFVFEATDLAGNDSIQFSANNVNYDTEAVILQSFTTNQTSGVYGPGSVIDITANYSEDVMATSSLTVILNNGVGVVLNNVSSSTISGTYTVGAVATGQDIVDLSVVSISAQNVSDLTGHLQSYTGAYAGTNLPVGIEIDVTTPVFSNIAPVSAALIDNVTDSSDMSYTISEDVATTTIIFNRTSGGGLLTQTCTTTAGYLTAGVYNNIDTTSACTGGAIVLTDGATYDITFSAIDAAGNIGSSMITGIRFGSDIIAPSISNVATSSITMVSALISFDTDEDANVEIDYGVDTSYGETKVSSAVASTSHSLIIDDLTPGETYYFRVRATDLTDNETTDDNSGTAYVFTTLSPATISNINITGTSTHSAIINFTTSDNVYGYVAYGLDIDYDNVVGDGTLGTIHAITLSGLQASTTYHYLPRIRDIYGDYISYSSDLTFSTNSDTAPTLDAFFSTTLDGVYGPGEVINISAQYSESLNLSSQISVQLNNGVVITLNNVLGDTISANYTVGDVGYGHDIAALAVNSIISQQVSDLDGNVENGTVVPATNIDTATNIEIDVTLPVLSNVLPENDSFIDHATSSSDISFTISEDVATGTIVMTRTGGNADASSPHNCTLPPAFRMAGTYNQFNTENCTEGAFDLATGTVYTILFTAIDAADNTASATRTNITYAPDVVQLQSFEVVEGNGAYGPSDVVTIRAVYSQNLQGGSSIRILLNTGVTRDLATVDANTLSGTYTIGSTGSGETVANLKVDSIITHNAISLSGTTQTSTGIGTNITDGVVIDTTAPIFSNILPNNSATIDSLTTSSDLSYQINEDLASGTIQFIRTAGSASVDFTCALTGTYLDSGMHSQFDVNNCVEGLITLVDGAIYTITYSGYDLAGNYNSYSVTGVNYGSDIDPPVISNVAGSSTTTNSIVISWTTDEEASSLVDYGTTIEYGDTFGDINATTTSHTVIVSDLSPNTIYHYRVRSIDTAGNESISVDHTFTTLALPTISGGSVDSLGDRSATIIFTTNNAAYGSVLYGLSSGDYDYAVSDEGLKTSHSVILSGLTPDTTYYFRPRMRSVYGDYSLGSEGSFTTNASIAPVLLSFTSSSTAATYGPGSVISVNANYDTALHASSTITVNLNSGVSVVLDTVNVNTLSGSYTVGVTASGENTNLLDVSSILVQYACNDDLNCETGIDIPVTNISDGVSIVIDTAAPLITGFAPSTDAFIDNTTTASDIEFTVSENMASSTIIFDAVSGPGSDAVCILAAGDRSSGSHTINTNNCSNGAVALVSTTVYDITIMGVDASGNLATTTNTNITYDQDTIQLDSFTSTSGDGLYGPGDIINITANYSKDLVAGSNITITLDTGTQVTLDTIDGTTRLIGTYTVGAVGVGGDSLDLTIASIDSQNATGTNGVAQTGTTIPGGNNLADNADIRVDTTAPTYDFTSPSGDNENIGSITTNSDISYTLSEDLTSATIQFIRTGGSVDASSPHTCTLNTGLTAGAHDQIDTDAVCNEAPINLVANAIYTIRLLGTDSAGIVGENVERRVITFGADTIAPSISNVVVGNITYDSVTVTWTTDENTNTLVDYSIDAGLGFTAGNSSASEMSHSVVINGLTASTTYNFRVRSVDAGNNTATSSVSTFTTAAGLDVTPPSISNVATSSLSHEEVTVTWTTDEASNSLIDYGETVSYGQTVGNASISTTTHSIVIAGLDPLTLYHFRVLSTDAAANTGTSSDYNFTTLVGPDIDAPTILNVATSTLTYNSITITWNTTEAASSIIDYGTTTSYNYTSGGGNSFVSNHMITLNNLERDTDYYFQVRSIDAAGNEQIDNPGYNFHTLFGPDTTDPVISAVLADNITSTSTRITWTTDEPATSLVDYDSSGAYGITSGNETLSTNHSVTLLGLSPGVTYYYQVRSADANDNESDSTGYQFTTVASPVLIGAPSVSSVTDESVMISFETTQSAYGWIDYGETALYGSIFGIDDLATTTHNIMLTGLTASTTYHFRPKIKDVYGNFTHYGADTTFTTNSSNAPVLLAIETTEDDGTYGPGDTIEIEATYSMNLAASSEMEVELDTGASVNLNTVAGDRITGTYVVGSVGSGEDSLDLTVDHIVIQVVCNEDNNCEHGVSLPPINIDTYASIIVDTTRPEYSNILPEDGSYIDNVTDASDISYTLSEDMASTTIYINRIGGEVDPNAPYTCTLSGTDLNAGNHFQFDTTNCLEGDPNLVSGTSYNFTFNGEDLAGIAASAVLQSNVTFDTDSLLLQSFTTTEVNGTYGPGDTIEIVATYNDDLAASSTITVVLDTGVSFTLSDIASSTLSGVYTIGETGSGENSSDLSVASISNHNAIDLANNHQTNTGLPGINISTASNIVIDTAAPIFTVSSPANSEAIDNVTNNSDITFSFDEDLSEGQIIFTQTAGTGDASSPHTCDLAAGFLSSSATYTNFDTDSGCDGGEITLADGAIYTVTFIGTDQFNNTGDGQDITGVLFSSDIVAPTINNVTVATTTSNSVTITWDTDDPASSLVDYGVDTSYGLTYGDKDEAVTNHSVTLIGLNPGSPYVFKVRSADPSGNEEEDDNSGSGYAFTTVALPDIFNVSATSINNETVRVTFNSTDPAYPYVDYGLTAAHGFIAGVEAGSATTSHEIIISGLNADTTYHYAPKIKDIYGNFRYGTDATVVTGSSDEIPPIISNVATSSVAATSITITWTTDENSNSFVDFGPNILYGSTQGDSTDDTTSHTVVLVGLAPETDYYFQVKSIDASGNMSVNNNSGVGYTFTTDVAVTGDVTPPPITNVQISGITSNGATITWDTTGDISDSVVGYSVAPSTNFQTEQGDASTTESHSINLTGLNPDTEYRLQIKSRDPAGNLSIDNNGGTGYVLTTASGADTIAPVISNVVSINIVSNEATITWDTNENSSSMVDFGLGAGGYTSTQGDSMDSTMNHSVTITGLNSNTTYYFRVRSMDASFNQGLHDNSGAGFVFTTQPGVADIVPPVITDIEADPVADTYAVISWETNEQANSKIVYGIASDNYTGIATSTVYNVSHALALTELNSDTEYFYRVVSVDISGNISTSSEESFTTLEGLSEESDIQGRIQDAVDAVETSSGGGGTLVIDKTDKIAPVVSNIELASTSQEAAIITWTTNEESTSFVEYGETIDYGFMDGQYNDVKDHTVTLRRLSVNTTYYYRIISIDLWGNVSKSDSRIMKTMALPGEEEIEEETEEEITPEEEIEEIIEEIEEEEELSPEEMLEAASKKIIELMSRTASQVSLGALESAIGNQFKSLKELAQLVPGPMLSGEPKVVVSETSATISWRTDKESNSLVGIVADGEYDVTAGDPYIQTVGNPDEETTMHEVILHNLNPGTTYHYQVRSKGDLGPIAESSDFLFITAKEVLEIERYNINVESAEKAIFTWDTNVESTAELRFTPYRNSVLSVEEVISKKDNALSLTHAMEVEEFEAGVTYKVELISRDREENIISKDIDTFTTSEDDLPPVISQVQTDSALSVGKNVRVQTIITWTTNELSTSRVFYEEGSIQDPEKIQQSTKVDNSYSKKHVAVINNFKPGKVYTFRVESVDSGGNITYSKVHAILTPQQEQSVFQVIMTNIEDIFGWVGNVKN